MLFVHHLDLCQTFPKLLRRISSFVYDIVSSTIAIYSQFLLGAHYLHPLCCSSLARVLSTLQIMCCSPLSPRIFYCYHRWPTILYAPSHKLVPCYVANFPLVLLSHVQLLKGILLPSSLADILQHVPCPHLSASMDAIINILDNSLPP